MYTRRHSFWLLSYVHGDSMIRHLIILYTYVTITYIHGVDSLSSFQLPLFPLLFPLYSPLYPYSTYLAPSSCDRNRPPSTQVACKLTLFAPPFTQLSHPFQFPRTPTVQRLTTTILGPLRSDYAEQVVHIHILFLKQYLFKSWEEQSVHMY